MYKNNVFIDILIAKELINKGKVQVSKGEKMLRIISEKLDKGGTTVICFKEFKEVDFSDI